MAVEDGDQDAGWARDTAKQQAQKNMKYRRQVSLARVEGHAWGTHVSAVPWVHMCWLFPGYVLPTLVTIAIAFGSLAASESAGR